MQTQRIVKTTAIYFIGNFASKFLAFFLLPLYTAYLTTESFGVVDILISVVSLIGPIFTLQTAESIFRFLFDETDETVRAQRLSSAFAVLLLGYASFSLVYFPYAFFSGFQYTWLFALYFFTYYFAAFFQQAVRGLGKSVDYAISGIVLTIIQAGLNILLIAVFMWQGEALLVAASVASIGVCVYLALRAGLYRYIRPRHVRKSIIIEQLKYGIPLIPNQIFWWVIGVFSKFVLLQYWDETYNGILALALKFPNLISTISAIFMLAWTENVIIDYRDGQGQNSYSSSYGHFFRFVLSGLAVLLPITRIYFSLTIDAAYAGAEVFIPLFYLGAIFNSGASLLGSIYTASKKTIHTLTTSIFAAVINVALSYLLIPSLAIWGVAIANSLSFIALFCLRVVSVRKLVRLQISFVRLLPACALAALCAFAYYIDSLWVQLAFLALAGLGFCWLNRTLLVDVLRVLRKRKQ